MTRLSEGAKEKGAKQKSWTHKETMHVRALSKGWGKEKGKKKSVTDKISRAGFSGPKAVDTRAFDGGREEGVA